VVGYVDSRVAATVAYDAASGTQLWASLYEGESPYYGASAAAVDVSQDGSTVFVGGGVLVGSAQSAYLTLAYSADTGDQRWLAIHDVGGDARQVLCCVAAGLGGVFVSGTAYVPVPGEQYPDPNYLTVAYDT
jgi:outer membrane protein assembly factor BamB